MAQINVSHLTFSYEPTMLFVEHDARFRERIATGTVLL